jgi:hypothetical protein
MTPSTVLFHELGHVRASKITAYRRSNGENDSLDLAGGPVQFLKDQAFHLDKEGMK